jgi:predicted FMN-binding regulatory protein PaiB
MYLPSHFEESRVEVLHELMRTLRLPRHPSRPTRGRLIVRDDAATLVDAHGPNPWS